MARVAVIGAYGSAGVATARALADSDPVEELVLIDDGEPGGGLCILRGCMPSKEVLSAGAHRYRARHDPRVGAAPPVDLAETVARKNDNTAGFAEHRRAAVHDLAEREHVTFHHETASFAPDPRNADPASTTRTLLVDGQRIEVEYVVIATGSRISLPDLPGFEDVDAWTSRDVLEATEFPDSGVVLGFGYVGVELVPYLAEVGGMDLTVIEHDDRPLDRAPPAFGDEILAQYREEFDVEVLTRSRERSIESTGDGSVELAVERADGDEHIVRADAVFAFTGREPNHSIGLEHTAVDPTEPWVDPTMRAGADPRIFAAGDVTGERMLLHNAKEEGAIAAANLRAAIRDQPMERYDPIHHSVMFAGLGVYPYASVGMTAEEAEATGLDPIVTSREATDDGVFASKDAPRGLARLVVAGDGTVLGYHGLHLHADVMAKAMQIVVETQLPVDRIPDRAFHPTTPEIIDGLLRDAAAALDRER